MYGKRFKRNIINFIRKLYHKNEKENIKEISLIVDDNELNLPTTMFSNYESNILDKWITIPINNKNIEREKIEYDDLFYNDVLDNINYDVFDELINDNNIKNKKDNIKKSPIIFNTSIVLIGITFGLILSQFLFPGVC
jgi:hypothetical protein